MHWNLPQGFTATTLLPEHEEAVAEVINAFFRWMNGGNVATLEQLRADWQEEDFHRETDTCVILDAQNRVVGYNDIWDANSYHVRAYGFFAVLPEMLGSGVDDYLVEWGIARTGQNVAKAPQDARVVLHMGANVQCRPVTELYARHGLKDVRHSYRMRIDFHGTPDAPQVPDGLVIRPIDPENEMRDALFVVHDAFMDHWGFVEEPFEAFYKRWLYHIETDPDYDPSLYFAAFDGDQAVGVSLCSPRIEEVENMAWVNTLGVSRAWRKRGLGLALLRHSFQEFYRRGSTSAGLGVDAENLTGATRLYEKAGMRVWRTNVTYEFEVRSGKDLMRQSLDQDVVLTQKAEG